MKSFIVFLLLCWVCPAQAYIELNVFYNSEALNSGTATTGSRMFVEASAGFAVDRESRFLVGWNYGMFSKSDAATTTTTYSSTQMGPRFIWFMNKSKSWSLGLAYNLVTKATYDDGSGSSEAWKGTALKFDVGYNFNLSESWLLGLRLNYSSASYTEKLVGSTTYSTVSNTSVMMYPSIYSIYLF